MHGGKLFRQDTRALIGISMLWMKQGGVIAG